MSAANCLWCGAPAVAEYEDHAYTRSPSGGMTKRGTGARWPVCADHAKRLGVHMNTLGAKAKRGDRWIAKVAS